MDLLAVALAWALSPNDAKGVEVRGDGGCLTAEALVARTLGWGGRARWPDSVAVAVTHAGSTLSVEVTPNAGPKVERTFEAVPPTCSDVELVAAVAIAMALDAADANAVREAALVAPVVVPPHGVVRITSMRFQRGRRPRTSIDLQSGVGVGVLPFVTGDVALGLRVAWPNVAVVGDIDVGARRVDRFDGATGVLGMVRIGGALGVCSPWVRRRWEASLCAAVRAGSMIAWARQTVAPRRDAAPWLAVAARTDFAVAVSPRWSLGVRSDVVLGVVRPAISAVAIPSGARRWDTPRIGWQGGVVARIQLGRIVNNSVK